MRFLVNPPSPLTHTTFSLYSLSKQLLYLYRVRRSF